MSNKQTFESSETGLALLRARYSKLLKGIDTDDLAKKLYERDLLSAVEKDVVLDSRSTIKKHREMCKALASKGASQVNTLSKVIKELHESPSTLKHIEEPRLHESNNKTWKPQHVDSQKTESYSSHEEAETKTGKVYRENKGKGNRSKSNGVIGSVDKAESSVSCSRSQGQQPTIQAKHEITDVPDPPVLSQRSAAYYVNSESESDSDSSTSDSECENESENQYAEVKQPGNQMEAFVVLFYMMVTQLLQAINSCNGQSNSSHCDHTEHKSDDQQPSQTKDSQCVVNTSDQSGDPGDHKIHPTSTDETSQAATLLKMLHWLKMDIPLEEIQDYFSPDEIKGVTPNSLSPVNLSVSVILEAFQQFFEKLKNTSRENSRLTQSAVVVKDLMKRNACLEAKLHELQRSKPTDATIVVGNHCTPSHSECTNSQVQRLQKELTRVLEKVKTLEPFQTAYTKSEERCKQLVCVTQEWAIECEEKDKLIAVLEAQIKQLQEEIDQLQKRVFKYKKHWMSTRDREDTAGAAAASGGGNTKVDPTQFEEVKLELAVRREFQDQVQAEKDEAIEIAEQKQQENEHLRREVEGLKDEIEELKDKLGNYKLHAKVKEPTVREMSSLSAENRQLKDKVQQLEDEILAYKTYVSELTQTPLEGGVAQRPTGTQQTRQSPQKPPPRQTARTQAMVTGYSVPDPLRKAAAKRQKPHPPGPVATVIPRGQQPPVVNDLIIEPHNHHHDDDHRHDDTDTVSTISDEDLSPSAVNGGTNAHLTNGHLLNRDTHTPNQFIASNPPADYESPLSGHFNGHISTVGDSTSFDQASVKAPPSYKSWDIISHGSTEDYTQQVRYPNHSGILVEPLCDDEVSLQGEGGRFTTSGRHPPKFYDPKELLPEQQKFVPRSQTPNQPEAFLLPGSALLAPEPLEDRECPYCQRTFLMLGEKEFQSHLAGCFK